VTAVEAGEAGNSAMEDLVIERMRASHVPDVAAIEDRTFDSPWTEGMFVQEVADSYLSRSWVAVKGRRVVAYVISWFLREEVHLLNIAVDESHRGKGYGRRMMQHLIDEAVRGGRGSVTLEVRESNLPARRLYESFGFQVVGRRKEYYQDNREDAVVMTLDLRSGREPS
jgi:ribosomal-protein-alanine N-acetyltransferase